MSHEPLKALSWALPEDLSGKSVLFVGAQPLSGLSEADVTYLQGFYPFVQALERQGASVACDWRRKTCWRCSTSWRKAYCG